MSDNKYYLTRGQIDEIITDAKKIKQKEIIKEIDKRIEMLPQNSSENLGAINALKGLKNYITREGKNG